jgi:uncharacterized protein (DUF1499 family)
MSVLCNKCSRPRTERRLGLLLALFALGALTSVAQDKDAAGEALTCTETPNCVAESREFDLAPEVLFSAAIRALDRIAPASVEIAPDRTRIAAEFRVFLFRDDVDLVIDNDDDRQTRLHIRSASRSGRWDAGVNARRVRSFFKHLDRVLQELSAQR